MMANKFCSTILFLYFRLPYWATREAFFFRQNVRFGTSASEVQIFLVVKGKDGRDVFAHQRDNGDSVHQKIESQKSFI